MRCKLIDIAKFNPQEPIKKGTFAKKVAMNQLQPFCRDISGYTLEPFTGGAKFRNGDTIMARITPCLENGKTAKVNILEDNEIGFGSTEYIVFRAKEKVCDEDYLYYLVCSSLVRDAAIRSMVGSSGRQRVQIDVVQNLEIELPSLDRQRQISSILSSLDDKIELNHKIIKNLEQQAVAIFEHNVVNKDVSAPGWEKSNLSDIADYLNGLAMQKYRPKDNESGIPVLKIKELRQGFCDSSSEQCSPNIKSEYLIRDGDVVFSWSGSLLVDIWCGGICGINQHLFKVTSNKYDKWFYYLWIRHYIDRFVAIAADKATTMGHIKREELAKAAVLLPSKNDYQKISAIMSPIFDYIIANKIESHKLITIRDTLLPKLMSGEIDVSKIDL